MRFTFIRTWRASVTSDGRTVTDGRVYQNWTSDIRVDLRPSSQALYAVRRSDSVVGSPNYGSIVVTPELAVSRDSPLRLVDERDEKAGAINPHLIARPARAVVPRATRRDDPGYFVLISTEPDPRPRQN